MDPLTAAMNAFTAFNTFLVTPAGQKMALDFEDAIGGLLNHFQVHLAPNAQALAQAQAAAAAVPPVVHTA